jgi:hypothetical protein
MAKQSRALPFFLLVLITVTIITSCRQETALLMSILRATAQDLSVGSSPASTTVPVLAAPCGLYV